MNGPLVVYLAAAFIAGMVAGIEIAVAALGRRRRGGMLNLDTPDARRRLGHHPW